MNRKGGSDGSSARRIRRAESRDVEAVRSLLREYSDGLGLDLSFQGFAAELADPLRFYDVVLLAEGGGADDGCAALRRIDDRTCELKRLYVRPSVRGGGLGRRLAEAAIAEARRRRYARMLLDTLPPMRAARGLYESLGFRETEPYRSNPVPGAAFLELRL
ncbi:MAG: GNAT family N-acetyltransferase [Actinomycetota bacterium]|nr:GNAT family N-acetyltransferase [Actinomycetota bacterium]